MALPVGAGWELDSVSGAALETLFDLSAASVRDMIAYAPEKNDWNMPARTPYNAGYAVFNLDIAEDAPIGRYQLRFVYDGGDELMKVGLCCPLSQCDAASAMIELKAVDEA